MLNRDNKRLLKIICVTILVAATGLFLMMTRVSVALPTAIGPSSEGIRIAGIGSSLWGASYEIISQQGTVIMADPAMMGDASPEADVITVSHRHFDHYDRDYVEKSTGRVSIGMPEDFNIKDVHVEGIAAAHGGFLHFWDRKNINRLSPSDTIYVYDVGGVRIAHLGDLGQDRLTEDQLRAMGKIDILISKLNNPFITLSCESEDKRSFQMIKQINPKVVIPTHTTDRCLIEYAGATNRELVEYKGTWTTSREELAQNPARLVVLQRQ
jgi:L-ascorbate metabolism protein UlaG (beta-lactamase superfamily)